MPGTLLLTLGLALPSPAAEEPAPPSAQVFPITFWAIHYLKDSPDYERAISDEQYQLIKDCRFNLVMGGPLAQAERFGLSCMSDAMTLPEFRNLWWTPNDPITEEQRKRIAEVVSAVNRASPALWGYFLADEPGEVLYPKVAVVRRIIKDLDATRPVFISLHPGQDVPKFIREVHPDLCAYDHYPIFDDGAPLDADIPPGFEHSSFLNDLARHRRACLAAGLRFLPTMLACGHYVDYEAEGVKYHRSYGHMTEARLRWQAYSALAYNAGGVSWFVYFPAGAKEYEPAAIGPDWRPTRTYTWLQKLNREAGAIGAVVRGLQPVGAYESEPFYCWHRLGLEELTPFDPEGFITGVEGGLVTAGEYRDQRGQTYLILVNRNVNERVEITPKLRWEQVRSVTAFDPGRCDWEPHPRWRRGQAPLKLALEAGDGFFLRVKP